MKINKPLPRRKSIRIKGYDYSQANAYYITVCTENRECVLGNVQGPSMQLNTYGEIVRNELVNTMKVRDNVEITEFVIMPNHFHAVVFISDSLMQNIKTVLPGRIEHYVPEEARAALEPGSIGAIVGQIKSISTKQIRKAGLPCFKWQRNYYEHIVRDEEDLLGIREYIINNPGKWVEDEYNATGGSATGRPLRF